MKDIPEKKPVLIFTIADDRNKPYEMLLRKSIEKFHPDVDYKCIEGEELQGWLKVDPAFFYRATPLIAEKYIDQYECVIKIDADSIILGDISYIWNTKDYDVATVINWNRVDAEQFGMVAGWGILPVEYFNAGLVAMRSRSFVRHWKELCFTPQFDRMQFREQDLLNAICYFGNYNVRCLDHLDKIGGNEGWWGLISKADWNRAQLKGKEIIIPKGEGDAPFPPQDVTLKVIHWASGNSEGKMNFRSRFQEDVVRRINEILK